MKMIICLDFLPVPRNMAVYMYSPHQAVIHQLVREMLARGGKMILQTAIHDMAHWEPWQWVRATELVKQLFPRLMISICQASSPFIFTAGSPRPGVGPQDVGLRDYRQGFANGYVKNKKVMEL